MNDIIDTEKYFSNNEYKIIVDCFLSELTVSQEKVIRLLYGLEDRKRYSVIEIATIFSVSEERVKQLVASSIRKLRNPKIIEKIIKERYMRSFIYFNYSSTIDSVGQTPWQAPQSIH